MNLNDTYLLPALDHLTCQPPFYCQCGLGAVDRQPKLNIDRLANTHIA
jgi:hypothetical protein